MCNVMIKGIAKNIENYNNITKFMHEDNIEAALFSKSSSLWLLVDDVELFEIMDDCFYFDNHPLRITLNKAKINIQSID